MYCSIYSTQEQTHRAHQGSLCIRTHYATRHQTTAPNTNGVPFLLLRTTNKDSELVYTYPPDPKNTPQKRGNSFYLNNASHFHQKNQPPTHHQPQSDGATDSDNLHSPNTCAESKAMKEVSELLKNVSEWLDMEEKKHKQRKHGN